jgi:hypothetical protein
MAGFSDFTEEAMLDLLFASATVSWSDQTASASLRTGTPSTTDAPQIFVGLATGVIADTETGTSIVNECAGGSYARKSTVAADWNAASAGTTDNANAITFVQASASWGVVTHFFLCDKLTTGNMIGWGSLTSSKTIDNGDTPEFAVGDLNVSLD